MIVQSLFFVAQFTHTSNISVTPAEIATASSTAHTPGQSAVHASAIILGVLLHDARPYIWRRGTCCLSSWSGSQYLPRDVRQRVRRQAMGGRQKQRGAHPFGSSSRRPNVPSSSVLRGSNVAQRELAGCVVDLLQVDWLTEYRSARKSYDTTYGRAVEEAVHTKIGVWQQARHGMVPIVWLSTGRVRTAGSQISPEQAGEGRAKALAPQQLLHNAMPKNDSWHRRGALAPPSCPGSAAV